MTPTEAVKMLREALETWNWNMGVEGSRLFDERRLAALAATAEPATPTYSADDLRKVAAVTIEACAAVAYEWPAATRDAEELRRRVRATDLDAIIAKAVK